MPSLSRLLSASSAVAVAVLAASGASAQATASMSAATLRSAPISNVRYEVTFDSATARDRSIHVAMTFDAASTAPVLLSLPIWTPGRTR